MDSTLNGRAVLPSARIIQRGLAVLLIGLVALFVLGTAANGIAPPVYSAGVVAVQLAIVVGFVFLVVILLQTGITQIRTGKSPTRILEIGMALVAVNFLLLGLWQTSAQATIILFGAVAGISLLLAGHILFC